VWILWEVLATFFLNTSSNIHFFINWNKYESLTITHQMTRKQNLIFFLRYLDNHSLISVCNFGQKFIFFFFKCIASIYKCKWKYLPKYTGDFPFPSHLISICGTKSAETKVTKNKKIEQQIPRIKNWRTNMQASSTKYK
jgi:hypothetical protein